ncbi:glycerophosphodiester phosphodiesterase [Simiduia agarivorans]|uniref:Glycerophosphoryl diester phosphodiesterase n=1 Tax=Simiduia agarivorans (strain DSM 21679 / JCM 13881 / BCRC 17597 / SA1) TaxID=1117647 RepID=K4KK51_SIMAS|nr:glycerophosphodiester phosphodiesterase [Simiduia agarivorans]AFU98605.1 glycerophosphoryl diester phosphodiesterase [Simiduia agarivorans SA1 = DSM 21679]
MPNPLFNIAHRGGKSGPENSLASIRDAVALGVDAVEIDVWALQDQIWVTHDRRLGRTIAGSGLIEQLTADELAALRLNNGEPLPTLPQVHALTRGRCLLNVEIKGPETASPLCRWIKQQVQLGQASYEDFLISSFDHVQLLYCMERLPEVRRAVLVEGIPLRVKDLCESLKAWAFNPSLSFINRDLVQAAKRAGLKVFVYTVNHPEDWAWLSELGVDGVFTDVPERLIDYNASVDERK